MSHPVLVPVTSVFPSRSTRWVNDACRNGKVRGAIKVAGTWFISAANVEALAGPSSAPDSEQGS